MSVQQINKLCDLISDNKTSEFIDIYETINLEDYDRSTLLEWASYYGNLE